MFKSNDGHLISLPHNLQSNLVQDLMKDGFDDHEIEIDILFKGDDVREALNWLSHNSSSVSTKVKNYKILIEIKDNLQIEVSDRCLINAIIATGCQFAVCVYETVELKECKFNNISIETRESIDIDSYFKFLFKVKSQEHHVNTMAFASHNKVSILDKLNVCEVQSDYMVYTANYLASLSFQKGLTGHSLDYNKSVGLFVYNQTDLKYLFDPLSSDPIDKWELFIKIMEFAK
jgi:hypothetical protein